MTSIRSTGYGARQLLEQLVARAERAARQLASGRRIATAADDPAGLAISKRLEAAVRGGAQGERNLEDGQSLVRTADAALQTSQDALVRMRELAIQAQNGTLSAEDRAAIQHEYDQLAASLDQTAGATSFGGRTLLDGSADGAGAIVLTDGRGGTTTVAIADAGAAALGVAGLAVAEPATLAALDQAQGMLASQRARLGAIDNSLAHWQNGAATTRANTEAARSRIEDVDVAAAVAGATRDRILTDLLLGSHRVTERSRARVFDLLG